MINRRTVIGSTFVAVLTFVTGNRADAKSLTPRERRRRQRRRTEHIRNLCGSRWRTNAEVPVGVDYCYDKRDADLTTLTYIQDDPDGAFPVTVQGLTIQTCEGGVSYPFGPYTLMRDTGKAFCVDVIQ